MEEARARIALLGHYQVLFNQLTCAHMHTHTLRHADPYPNKEYAHTCMHASMSSTHDLILDMTTAYVDQRQPLACDRPNLWCLLSDKTKQTWPAPFPFTLSLQASNKNILQTLHISETTHIQTRAHKHTRLLSTVTPKAVLVRVQVSWQVMWM